MEAHEKVFPLSEIMETCGELVYPNYEMNKHAVFDKKQRAARLWLFHKFVQRERSNLVVLLELGRPTVELLESYFELAQIEGDAGFSEFPVTADRCDLVNDWLANPYAIMNPFTQKIFVAQAKFRGHLAIAKETRPLDGARVCWLPKSGSDTYKNILSSMLAPPSASPRLGRPPVTEDLLKAYRKLYPNGRNGAYWKIVERTIKEKNPQLVFALITLQKAVRGMKPNPDESNSD